MRNFFFLFAVLVLSVTSCQPELKDKKTHPIEQTHNYSDEKKSDVTNEDSQTPDSNPGDEEITGEKLYNLYRDLWQNPFGVIEQMGDLSGKTIADIGAGPYGYFSIQLASRTKASKVIAIDIDQDAIDFIEEAKKILKPEVSQKIDTRLVLPDDPKLGDGEIDVILIVNTAIFFEDRVEYFKNLRTGLAKDGKLVIIDFKMRNSPVGPPTENRIPLGQMEAELTKAGYQLLESDDRTLEYQYIVIAGN